MAVSGVTIIQEFVVANEDGPSQHQAEAPSVQQNGGQGASGGNSAHLINDNGNHISPGSKIGDVVLVIAWDLECVEALGGKPGTPTVSVLTAANRLSPSPHARQAMLQPSPQHSTIPLPPSASRMQNNGFLYAQTPPTLTHTQPSPHIPHGWGHEHQQQQHQQAMHESSLLRKRGLSVNKPNLMVAIPPVPSYLSAHHGQGSPYGKQSPSHLSPGHHLSQPPTPSPSVGSAMTHNPVAWGLMQQRGMQTPVTPFPQMIQTPQEPPAMNGGSDELSKVNRDRLARAWTANGQSTSQSLNSPLDMTFGGSAMMQNQFNFQSNSFTSSCPGGSTSSATAPTTALGISGIPGTGALLSPANFESEKRMQELSSAEMETLMNSANDGMINMDHLSTQEWMDQLLQSVGVAEQQQQHDRH